MNPIVSLISPTQSFKKTYNLLDSCASKHDSKQEHSPLLSNTDILHTGQNANLPTEYLIKTTKKISCNHIITSY